MSSFVISTPLYNARYMYKVRSFMRVCALACIRRIRRTRRLRRDPRSHGGALGWSPTSGGKTSRCERRELSNWNVLFHLLFGKQEMSSCARAEARLATLRKSFRGCARESATSSSMRILCCIHRETLAFDRYGSPSYAIIIPLNHVKLDI